MIEYKISKLPPPNYEGVRERLKVPHKFEDGLVFAYYPYIHVYRGKLSPDLIVHETTHLERQKEIGVDVWWNEYVNSEQFRFKEELLAYRAQYKWVVRHTGKARHYFWLKTFAQDMVDIYNFTDPNLFHYMNLIKS